MLLWGETEVVAFLIIFRLEIIYFNAKIYYLMWFIS